MVSGVLSRCWDHAVYKNQLVYLKCKSSGWFLYVAGFLVRSLWNRKLLYFFLDFVLRYSLVKPFIFFLTIPQKNTRFISNNLRWSGISNQIFCINLSVICSAVLLSLNYIKKFLIRVLFVFTYIIFYKQVAYNDNILCFNLFKPNYSSLLSCSSFIFQKSLYHIDVG